MTMPFLPNPHRGMKPPPLAWVLTSKGWMSVPMVVSSGQLYSYLRKEWTMEHDRPY